MSSVFVARDNVLGRMVVVKVLPYELAATVSVDRFKREIMLSAALQHPHIVPVLSAGEADGLPFFIMPFVEGESVRARLARGPLSVREAVSILKDVARALQYAHGRGIIHRDIKPDNILLTAGTATVTDFGVAKAISASRETAKLAPGNRSGTITLVGTSIGTPAYMAPEQAAGDPATDHRADLYALGIVGYEMLVGAPPFHGRAPQQLLAAQLTEAPQPIGQRRYDVPQALAQLIMRLLEKEPGKRPKTAYEVVRSLEDPSVVSGTFASAPVPRRDKPKRVLWALAGAGILASVAAGSAWFTNRHPSGLTTAPAASAAPAVAAKSIAVLPLVNISRDTSDNYFAAGMTAELTNALSRIRGLRVATGSESGARAQAADPTDFGKSMNVTMVLVGTVQRDKDRLRVTARLVNTADGFTIWSDMFERESKDVFKVQDEISSAIVAAISPELSSAAAPDTAVKSTVASTEQKHGTNDLEAYDLYLRGQFFFDKRGEAALRRALDYFEQAAKKDPTFARPYAGIANVYALLPLYANVRVDSVMPLAMQAIDKAIALDSTLAEAFASRATLLQANWRWPEAERDYQRALSLDANSETAHQWYGELLLLNARTTDAQVQLKRATELAPLSPIAHGSYALALAVGHANDAAITAARRAVELDSGSVASRFMLGAAYLQAGRLPDGVRELETATRIDPNSVQALGLLGYAYARSGKAAEAQRIERHLEAAIGKMSGAAAAAARVSIGLGNNPHALDLLERAVGNHDSFFSSESLAEGFFDPIRADPRFATIVARAGLDNRLTTK
jgi:serine/threonine-protein kinase